METENKCSVLVLGSHRQRQWENNESIINEWLKVPKRENSLLPSIAFGRENYEWWCFLWTIIILFIDFLTLLVRRRVEPVKAYSGLLLMAWRAIKVPIQNKNESWCQLQRVNVSRIRNFLTTIFLDSRFPLYRMNRTYLVSRAFSTMSRWEQSSKEKRSLYWWHTYLLSTWVWRRQDTYSLELCKCRALCWNQSSIPKHFLFASLISVCPLSRNYWRTTPTKKQRITVPEILQSGQRKNSQWVLAELPVDRGFCSGREHLRW